MTNVRFKEKILNTTILEVFFILLLSLTPLLWYKGGFLVLGHDAGFPLEPVGHFLDRLYAWTDRLGFGTDQTQHLGGFIIHGFEALLSFFGLTIFAVQKITFIFWFAAPGLAMYFLLSSLHSEKYYRFLRLFGSIFYMFNHFMLQGWFIAERTKFSSMVALTILLALFIKNLTGKMSLSKTVILSSFVIFLFNGGGFLPLYGGLLVSLSFAVAYFTALNFRQFGFAAIKGATALVIGVLAGSFLVNAYWLFPQLISFLGSYSQTLGSFGGIEGVLRWVDAISKNASLLNLFRLQGIPDWYDNPLHPYADIFLDNPFLIIVSFLFPVLAFSAIFFAKKNIPIVIFFSLLSLVGMIFTAGSHPPFGFFYTALAKYLPGFVIFRTPFYKFAPVIFLSFAYLIGFSLNTIIQKVSQLNFVKNELKNLLPVFLASGAIFAVILYSFPFLTGSFFVWKKPLSTMVAPPDYIFSFSEWVNSKERQGARILLLPEVNEKWKVDTYSWNYWSLTSLPTLLGRNSIVTNDSSVNEAEGMLVQSLYQAILDQEDDQVKNLAGLLDINYFLLRKDFFWDLEDTKTSSLEKFESFLAKTTWIELEKTFGQWQVFRLKNNPDFSKIFATSNFIYFQEPQEKVPDVVSLSGSESGKKVITSSENLLKAKDSALFITPSCINCSTKEEGDFLRFSPRILPGSLFYFLTGWRENSQEKRIESLDQKLMFDLGLVGKRLGEIKTFVETKESGEITVQVIRRLKERLSIASTTFQELKDKNLLTQDLVQRILALLEHQEIETIQIARISEDAFDKRILRSLGEIIPIFSEFKSQVFRDGQIFLDEKKRVYRVNVPRSFEYEVFIKRRGIEDIFNLSAAGFFVDNQKFDLEPKTFNKRWFSLGKFNLSEGDHKIEIEVPQLEDILGPWQFAPGNSAQQDANQLNFEISTQAGCIERPLKSLFPRLTYKIEFDYQFSLGVSPQFVVKESSEYEKSDRDNLARKLAADGKSRNFRMFYTPEKFAKSAALAICPFSDGEFSSKGIIKNFKVKPLFLPEILLYSPSKNVSIDSQPNISITQINQTLYKVKVEGATGAYFLVFNKRFTPSWKLTKQEGDIRSAAGNPHFLANGYANGWLITEKGNNEFILQYRPQRLVYFGFLITVLSLIFSLSLFLFKIWKK